MRWLLLCLVIGCTSDDQTIETLQKAGYTDIEPGSWAPFSCSDDDTVKTSFRAKNPAGQTVTGVVCCGLILKSCTIRF